MPGTPLILENKLAGIPYVIQSSTSLLVFGLDQYAARQRIGRNRKPGVQVRGALNHVRNAGQFVFQISGVPGIPYVIQSSTNLHCGFRFRPIRCLAAYWSETENQECRFVEL